MEYHEKLWYTRQEVREIASIYEGFECAVADGSVTSDWFMIKSGVKQGCMMSGFLFLLCLHWVMTMYITMYKTLIVECFNIRDEWAAFTDPFNA